MTNEERQKLIDSFPVKLQEIARNIEQNVALAFELFESKQVTGKQLQIVVNFIGEKLEDLDVLDLLGVCKNCGETENILDGICQCGWNSIADREATEEEQGTIIIQAMEK